MDDSGEYPTRRMFLKGLGAAPTLTVIGERLAQDQVAPAAGAVTPKFTPLDLTPWFNTTVDEFGARRFRATSGAELELGAEGLARLPRGSQELRGIPFRLGPDGREARVWLSLCARSGGPGARSVEVPIDRTAHFICFAHFCDWESAATPLPTVDDVERLGEELADAVLVYTDGSEHRQPIRRRYEVQTPSFPLGQWCFAAAPHLGNSATRLDDPLRNGLGWGLLQTGVHTDALEGPSLWLWTLPNRAPEKPIRALRIEARSESSLVVCGLTDRKSTRLNSSH